jgi:uncharacterized membrane protein YfcA
MPLDISLVAQLALLGVCTGLLAGLLGIGGGMLMVPCLTLLLSQRGLGSNLSVKVAIATSMATILFTSISSIRAHQKRRAIRWEIVRRLAPGIVAGSLVASLGVFALLSGRFLAIFFALFVAFSATQMFLGRKPASAREMPATAGQLGAGAGIGFLSGLVGAGGGFISVPFMVWCNIPIHTAVATSAALGFPIAAANVSGYLLSGSSTPAAFPGLIGYIWLPALAVLALCSAGTAPLGARAAHSLPVAQLKRLFASLLYGLAGYMLWKGLAS